MTPNISLEIEQEQRVVNDIAAYEYKIEQDSFEGIRAEAREHGSQGEFPTDPNSEIYWLAFCEGLREYAMTQMEINLDWENLPF